MKKQLLALSFVLGFWFCGSAQTIPEWVNTFGNDPLIQYETSDMVLDKVGNMYLTGGSGDTFNHVNCVTIKYDNNGTLIWHKSIEALGAHSKIKVDNAQNVYVSIAVRDSLTDVDFLTIKYNADGDTQWTARYSSPMNLGIDYPTNIMVDDSMNVYVIGTLASDTSAFPHGSYATIKYNSSGVQQWVAKFAMDYYQNYPADLDIDSNYNVYITGYTSDTAGFGVVTIKYNANGSQLWLRKYHGDIFGYGSKIEILDNQYLYVCGDSSYPGWSDFLAIKYDLSGNQIWASTFDAASYFNGCAGGWDRFDDMKIDKQGNVYMTGDAYDGTGCQNYLTVKFNADGVFQWANTFDGGYGWDEARSLAIDDSGKVYVTGYSSDTIFDTNLITTIIYDSAGNTIQTLKYLQALHEDHKATNIALDSLNHIYVSGNIVTSNSFSIIAFKYGSIINSETTLNSEIQFSLFPNPATNSVTISIDETMLESTASVYDITGRKIAAVLLNTQYSLLNTSRFASGVYFVTAENEKGRVTKKLVIEK